MKKSKFTEAQIVFALKQAETGTLVEEVCRKLGISEATFYNWKKKYGALGVSELRQLKEENTRLKQMVADLSLDKQMLQDVVKKNFEGSSKEAIGALFTRSVQGIHSKELRGDYDTIVCILLSAAPARRHTLEGAHQGDCAHTGQI